MKKTTKHIFYYITIYLGCIFINTLLSKPLKIKNLGGFIHPTSYNLYNTSILLLVGILILIATTFIFYRKFSLPKTFYYILLISSLILTFIPDSISSYYSQSTGGGGYILTLISYPLFAFHHVIYHLDLLKVGPLILLIFFIFFKLITNFIDLKILKVNS
ncbi:MAG: hypothetical protein ACRCYE_05160 [Sarcina sp.]